ncbi:MAG: acetate--CoA ligase family protein, partial [bacterium]
ADLAAARAIEFPPLEGAHRRAVQATLNEYVRVDNPLDYHTFIWGDRLAMRDTFAAMMAGDYDLTLLLLDTPADDRESLEIWLRAVSAFADACADSGKRGALVASLSESLPDEVARVLREHGIAPLQGLDQALAAVEAACKIGRAWARQAALPALNANHDFAARDGLRQLDEHDAKQRLAAIGFDLPSSIVVTSADEAVAAAEHLLAQSSAQSSVQSGGAVALKALSNQIAHKSEVGAVALDLRDGAQVRAQATRMLNFAERLLVESMVVGAVAEMLLSVGYNPAFGHGLMIGCGGAEVELIGDRQLLLLPVDEAMLRRALSRLRTAPLLHGYRGRPRADVDAVVACALRLGEWIEREPNIVEVEINPLMIQCANHGAVVADAVMTMRDETNANPTLHVNEECADE